MKKGKKIVFFLIGIACIFLICTIMIRQRGCEKKIWKNLSEMEVTYSIELKEISILDKVKDNDQTYVLADAEFDSEENEDVAAGASGLYVYRLNEKKWLEDVVLVYGPASKSISAGFTAYLYTSDEQQILFGNLKDTRYDAKNDEIQDVNYESIQILDDDDNILVSTDVKGKSGYLFILQKNQKVKKIQLLDGEDIIDSASSDYNDGEENHIINSN